jgi:hypothetical protein
MAAMTRMFRNCEFLGQNPIHALRASTMQTLGRMLPGHAAVRINQALKIPQLLFDRQSHHAVQPMRGNRAYEVIIVIGVK